MNNVVFLQMELNIISCKQKKQEVICCVIDSGEKNSSDKTDPDGNKTTEENVQMMEFLRRSMLI